MAQTVKLQVNEANLVRNLRHAFARKDTFLAELMQNARRAQADFVAFWYEPETRTLTVEDDGVGLENPQDILTVAESGWDDETKAQEHPFGMGFLAAVYQAERVEIRSRGHRIAFDTDQVLGFEPVAVESVPDLGTTRITLTGVPDQDYRRLIRGYARGFPIPVLYNDEECPRPHAPDSGLDFLETEMGRVYLQGRESKIRRGSRLGTEKMVLYLQGIEVYNNTMSLGVEEGNIFHLDPARYVGKLPDRDRLIDEREVVREAEALVRALWREELEARARITAPEVIARDWYRTLDEWGMLHLLNEVPYVPAEAVAWRSGYPVSGWEHKYRLEHPDEVIPQSSVESGEVSVVLESEKPYSEETGWQAAMYLYLKEALVVQKRLDPGHWLHRHLVEITPEDVEARVQGHTHEALYQGNWVPECEVLFASRVTLRGPLGEVDCLDAFLMRDGFVTFDRGSLFWEDPLFVVPDSEHSGDVVRQYTDFVEDCVTDERAMEEEIERFERFLLSERPGNELVLLKTLLRRAGVTGYDALSGRAFRIEIEGRDLRVGFAGWQMCLPANVPARAFLIDGEDVRVFERREDGVLAEAQLHPGAAADRITLARTLLRETLGKFAATGSRCEAFARTELPASLEGIEPWVVSHFDVWRWHEREANPLFIGGRDPLHGTAEEWPDGILELEVKPVAREPGYENAWSAVNPEEGDDRVPEFWTVYGRDESGLAHALVDCADPRLAQAMAEHIEKSGLMSIPF